MRLFQAFFVTCTIQSAPEGVSILALQLHISSC